MKAVAAVLVALLCVGCEHVSLWAQESGKHGPSVLGSNAEGVHFFVGFMQNETDACGVPSIYRAISIASRFSTEVTVRMPDGREIHRSLAPFEIAKVDVDEQFECFGEGVFRKGIEVTSTEPVSVYCYNSRTYTSDGYLALPVGAWGTQYVTANYYLDHYTPLDSNDVGKLGCSVAPRGGEFAVLASENNTVVSVYPKTLTVTGIRPGEILTRTLMKGEILQVQDGDSVRGGSDITGSVVVADKPVGLLSGHVRTAIPWIYDTKDHLIEMIPPREMLSDHHIVVPFGGRRGGDLVRVITSEPGTTTVTVSTADGVGDTTLQMSGIGLFMEYDLQQVAVITSTRPVLVVQYSRSNLADPNNKDPEKLANSFDPNMVVVTPTDQYVNAAVFQTLPNKKSNNPDAPAQFDRHLMTVIVEETAFPTVELDGRRLADYPGLDTGTVPDVARPYLWATLQVADGQTHVLTSDGLLGGYVYGMGKVDSYAWPIGSGMKRLHRTDENRPRFSSERRCDRYQVRALDSGTFESGLRNVWLDSAASVNVTFEQGIGINGDDFRTGSVMTIDPNLPGIARIVAEDLFGNRDTVDLALEIVAPRFALDSIVAKHDPGGKITLASVDLANKSGLPMTVDSVRLLHGREFVLVTRYEGRVLDAATALTVTVAFKSDLPGRYTDTLLVWCNCRLYMVPLIGLANGPKIATEDLEYGPVRVGSNRVLDLNVWNSGVSDLRIDSMNISTGAFSDLTMLKFPFVLGPGRDTTLQLRFDPPAVGEFLGNVWFYSDADSVAIASLHGRGIYPSLSIGGHDYGSVQVGDTSWWNVPIANPGKDTAHVRGVAFSDPAGFLPESTTLKYDLAEGDTAWVRVGFVPVAERQYSTEILVQNEDGLEAANTLIGRGYALRASIDGYDWGPRWVGSVHDTIVNVCNAASYPVTIDRVWIDVGDIGDFDAAPLPAPITLGSGEIYPVVVRFSPLQPGLRESVIMASTDSRDMPVVENKLEGFGLIAMAKDDLEFDDSPVPSCESRSGRLTIHNDGNTPLTIAGMELNARPDLVQANLPNSGYMIAVGDVLIVDFTVNFGGVVDTVSGALSWSFAEIPETFSRSFGVRSSRQKYDISVSAPQSVPFGGMLDLSVGVGQAVWSMLPESEATLTVRYNPRIALFDPNIWKERTDTITAGWKPYQAPEIDPNGILTLRFQPAWGAAMPIEFHNFPPLPFRAFIGDLPVDTFVVTMTAGCAQPAVSAAAYRIDSICGLSQRLFVFTGEPYALRPARPNPATGSTEIDFTLGMDAQTKLEVYNSNGALVLTLVDDYLSAGTYSVGFDASALSSGQYYYRLVSGAFSRFRQMQIMK